MIFYGSFELTLYDAIQICGMKCFEDVEIHHLADFETLQAPRKACFCLFLLVRDFTWVIWIQRVILRTLRNHIKLK